MSWNKFQISKPAPQQRESKNQIKSQIAKIKYQIDSKDQITNEPWCIA